MRALTILSLPVAAAAAAALATTAALAAPVTPGQWTQEVRTTELVAPGLPPQALQMMPKTFSNSYCLTPEEAARGPKQMLESAQRGDGSCKYSNFSMQGGKIAADMQCTGDGMGNTRMRMRGDYTATTYTMTMVMESNGPIQRMTSISSGRRTGPCK